MDWSRTGDYPADTLELPGDTNTYDFGDWLRSVTGGPVPTTPTTPTAATTPAAKPGTLDLSQYFKLFGFTGGGAPVVAGTKTPAAKSPSAGAGMSQQTLYIVGGGAVLLLLVVMMKR